MQQHTACLCSDQGISVVVEACPPERVDGLLAGYMPVGVGCLLAGYICFKAYVCCQKVTPMTPLSQLLFCKCVVAGTVTHVLQQPCRTEFASMFLMIFFVQVRCVDVAGVLLREGVGRLWCNCLAGNQSVKACCILGAQAALQTAHQAAHGSATACLPQQTVLLPMCGPASA